MEDVFIVGSKRTPIGAFLGALSSVPATELGSIALKAALEQAGVQPDQVDELYFGNVLPANLGQAPATQVALGAGCPTTTPCTIINKVCASGTKAIMVGSMSIRLGDAEIVAVGGMENMSRVPFYNPKGRTGNKYGNIELLDGLVRDGLQDVYSGAMMGEAGEQTAEKHGFTREQQDEYAIRAYNRAEEAANAGKFDDEITPVTIKTRKGETVVEKDEEVERVRYDKIPKLRPAFRKEGTITAANASKLNDGAAAMILASESAVKKYNLKPLARVVSWADAARDPMEFTVAPADALPIALKKADKSVADIGAFEINEAFSVVAMANQKLLEIDDDKLNVLGGAVSLGHPLGASGTRITNTLISALKDKNQQYGAVGICNGGGGASALIIERVDD